MDEYADRIQQVLTEERADTAAQIRALTHDLDGIIEAAAMVATDDEHDPEGTTIAYERAHTAAQLAAAVNRLEELDRALARHAAGDYGRCEACGGAIDPERLAVRPAATTCIGCAR
ncbi:TraR/DksA family transcriptional regulator [Cryptosporangium aurantiacum]|uniref:Transcriptional regulator, TraR/DksA family n=1 Tax=Cryptosporangium aurantiacum TaxID=134849 RepID=A0A1M7RLN6_9ACTN|nr:TraR/DksA C4-type zinc finger protein [Cryptosporangium aurantiacum]SHN47090.1 transcriptional regulator, TraR/DksA family [Cryptosporangium aurantiacum]